MFDICVSDLDKIIVDYKKKRIFEILSERCKPWVDIPEFMKPIEQRQEHIINQVIENWEHLGLIDKFYFELLEEIENR